MTYLTGDGRLCAFAMTTREGVVASESDGMVSSRETELRPQDEV